MSDKNGHVWASVPGLALRSGVTREETEIALKRFLSPDPDSRTKDHEGRRIAEIDGGWAILNHAKYRALMSAEERREYQRIKQAEYRQKRRALKAKGPLPYERAAVKAMDNGNHQLADQLAATRAHEEA